MKRTWLLVPALALSFAGGVRSASAADAAPAAPKLTKLQKEGKLTPKAKEKMEALAGKPLTAEQEKTLVDEDIAFKAALQDLNAKHDAKIAVTLGLTVEQMNAAEKAAREKAMADKKAAAGAPAVAPK